jgi:hypothetical protein
MVETKVSRRWRVHGALRPEDEAPAHCRAGSSLEYAASGKSA